MWFLRYKWVVQCSTVPKWRLNRGITKQSKQPKVRKVIKAKHSAADPLKTNCLFGFCHDSCLRVFRLGRLLSVLFRINKMLWKKIYATSSFFFIKAYIKIMLLCKIFSSMIGCRCFGEESRVWLSKEVWYCLMSIFVYGAVITSRRRLELETVFSWTVLETFAIVSLQLQPRAEQPLLSNVTFCSAYY